eukprot:scaffold227692_cov27-Tisochrysis_lutea.AAC.1
MEQRAIRGAYLFGLCWHPPVSGSAHFICEVHYPSATVGCTHLPSLLSSLPLQTPGPLSS